MNKKPFLILICGPSGSGKTTLANFIKDRLSQELNCAIFSQDNFYLTKNIPVVGEFNNYDHPASFDWKKINSFIDKILNKKSVKLNIYDYKKSQFSKEYIEFSNNYDVFIFEGIYALFDEKINKIANLKLYIDTELDECLIRRIERDVKNRGRTIDSVINQWRNVVKPMYSQHISHQRLYADLIIPSDYDVSLNLLDSGIKGIFKKNEK